MDRETPPPEHVRDVNEELEDEEVNDENQINMAAILGVLLNAEVNNEEVDDEGVEDEDAEEEDQNDEEGDDDMAMPALEGGEDEQMPELPDLEYEGDHRPVTTVGDTILEGAEIELLMADIQRAIFRLGGVTPEEQHQFRPGYSREEYAASLNSRVSIANLYHELVVEVLRTARGEGVESHGRPQQGAQQQVNAVALAPANAADATDLFLRVWNEYSFMVAVPTAERRGPSPVPMTPEQREAGNNQNSFMVRMANSLTS